MTVTTGDGQSVQLSTEAYPAAMTTRYILCTKTLCFFRVTNSDTGTLICHSEDIRALAIAIQAVGSGELTSERVFLGTEESSSYQVAGGWLDLGRPQFIGDSRWKQEWNNHLKRPAESILTLANSEVVCKVDDTLIFRSDDYQDILAGILDSIISKYDGDAAEADWVALKELWGV